MKKINIRWLPSLVALIPSVRRCADGSVLHLSHRPSRRPRRLAPSVAVGLLLLAPGVRGQSLQINGTYKIDGTSQYPGGTYQEVDIGYSSGGELDQSGGSLNVSSKFVLGLGGTGFYNLSGGTFTQTGGSGVYIGDNYTGLLTQTGGTFNASAVSVYLASGSANGNLTISGNTGLFQAGSLILGGTSSGVSSTVSLNGGTLATGSVSAGAGTSTFLFNGGTLQATRNNANFFAGLGNAVVGNSGSAVIDTNGFNVTIAQALVHSNALAANTPDGGLTKNGNGTLTLTSTGNTFNGGTVVNAGTLVLGNGTSAASLMGNNQATGSNAVGGTAVTVNNAATFQVQAQASVTGGNGGSGDGISGAGGNGGAGVSFAAGGKLTNAGTISGGQGASGSFSNGSAGAGVLFSGGAGTLTNQQGGVINGGVRMDGASANAVTFQIGSTINGNLFIGPNAGSTLTLTDNGTGGSQLYSQAVTGVTSFNGALVKTGTGTWSLDQALSYAGSTTVAVGTLLANNASGSATGSGAVQVQSGATLGGGGTISGNVVAQSGSTIGPGAAAQLASARLTLGGTLTLQNNSLLAVKLGGAAGGSGYDQVFAGSGFTLGGNLQLSLVNGFAPTPGQFFTILDNTGTSLNSGTFANAPAGLYTDAAGDRFVVNYASNADAGLVPNDVTLTYVGTVVPEPGTWMLLGVGTGALGLALRRRHVAAAARV